MAKKPRNGEAEGDAPKATKSIVPAKYANKYKGGGSGNTAAFINGQVGSDDGIVFPSFFELCRKNNIPEEQVAKYEGQVAEGQHGSQGRARMTLGNMLRAKARKDGKLVNLNGQDVELNEPKLVVSGAAARKQEQAEAA